MNIGSERTDMCFKKLSRTDVSRFYPMISEYFEDSDVYDKDLVVPRAKFLRQLTPDQITNVEVIREFEDDHLPCVDVHVTFSNGVVMTFGAWWISTRFIGACYFTDSQSAKNEIVEYIKSNIPADCIQMLGEIIAHELLNNALLGQIGEPHTFAPPFGTLYYLVDSDGQPIGLNKLNEIKRLLVQNTEAYEITQDIPGRHRIYVLNDGDLYCGYLTLDISIQSHNVQQLFVVLQHNEFKNKQELLDYYKNLPGVISFTRLTNE